MRYLKTFEGMIDDLNKQAISKKTEAGEELTVLDITTGSDIYCGNHTNPNNESEICGYYFGEKNDGPAKEFAEKIVKRKCPDCGMEIGRRVMYISNEELREYEEDLPGEGFYLFSKDDESDLPIQNGGEENKSDPMQNSGDKENVMKSNSSDIFNHLEKYFNVLLAAYVAITPQKHKVKINESSIRKAMETLRRECKYKDNKRTEDAIKEFNMFISPMMLDAGKNIQTWKLGSNGKKYYDVFNSFITQLKG